MPGHQNKNTKISYVRGFHPPTRRQQTEAIGCPKSMPVYLEPSESFFDPVSEPLCEDDWLAQYNEEGQSYNDFIDQCPWLSRRKVKYMRTKFISNGKNIKEKYPDGKIYLVQLGEFVAEEAPSMKDLVMYAQAFFRLPVDVLPDLKLEVGNGVVHLIEKNEDPPSPSTGVRKSFRSRRTRFNARFDSASKQLQLSVDSVLHYLKRIIPGDAFCLVALTMHDLYADPSDLFVAGMAAGNHRVGVFSFHRYDPSLSFSPEFWYESEQRTMNQDLKCELILQRSCKLLVHEISHILGIDHCIYFSCCMNGSGHLEEDYRQSMHLCPVDLHKLHHLCGFAVTERYECLLGFFKRFGMIDEAKWITRRLEFIRAKTS